MRQLALPPRRGQQRQRIVRVQPHPREECVESPERAASARHRRPRQPTAGERGEVTIHERHGRFAPIAESVVLTERDVVGEVLRVSIKRAWRQPPAPLDLVEPGFDGREQDAARARDRGAASGRHRASLRTRGGRCHAAPSRLPRCSSTRSASVTGTRARSAISWALECCSICTEPNALSMRARRAGPTPST